MMKRVLATLSLAALYAAGCVPSATDDELKQMCENLVKLRGDIDDSSEKALIAAEEERFKKEAIRLKDWKARDLKGWDDELAAKLAEVEKEEDKEALKAEYEKKKAVTASKHDPGIAALDGKKKQAIEDAKKKFIENQAARDGAIRDCVDTAKTEGINQKVAKCRIGATSTDQYWNACR
jgi:hypothetical protein